MQNEIDPIPNTEYLSSSPSSTCMLNLILLIGRTLVICCHLSRSSTTHIQFDTKNGVSGKAWHHGEGYLQFWFKLIGACKSFCALCKLLLLLRTLPLLLRALRGIVTRLVALKALHMTWFFFPWFEDLKTSFFFGPFLHPPFFPPLPTFQWVLGLVLSWI